MRLQYLKLNLCSLPRVSGKLFTPKKSGSSNCQKEVAVTTQTVGQVANSSRNVHLSSEKSQASHLLSLPSWRSITLLPVELKRWSSTCPSLYRSMDEISHMYVEAKEHLDNAQRYKDTIYFEQDFQRAQEAVSHTLKRFQELMESLDEAQRGCVLHSLGQHMDELVALEQAIKNCPT